MFNIFVIKSSQDNRGQAKINDNNSYSLGMSYDMDIILLHDKNISPHHADIIISNGKLIIRALAEVSVNGGKIKQNTDVEIFIEDCIAISDTLITISKSKSLSDRQIARIIAKNKAKAAGADNSRIKGLISKMIKRLPFSPKKAMIGLGVVMFSAGGYMLIRDDPNIKDQILTVENFMTDEIEVAISFFTEVYNDIFLDAEYEEERIMPSEKPADQVQSRDGSNNSSKLKSFNGALDIIEQKKYVDNILRSLKVSEYVKCSIGSFFDLKVYGIVPDSSIIIAVKEKLKGIPIAYSFKTYNEVSVFASSIINQYHLDDISVKFIPKNRIILSGQSDEDKAIKDVINNLQYEIPGAYIENLTQKKELIYKIVNVKSVNVLSPIKYFTTDEDMVYMEGATIKDGVKIAKIEADKISFIDNGVQRVQHI